MSQLKFFIKYATRSGADVGFSRGGGGGLVADFQNFFRKVDKLFFF